MPKLYIKKTVIEYYPITVIIKLRVSTRAKYIISIDTSYILIKSKEDIKTKDT
jgi:hypothetical protein